MRETFEPVLLARKAARLRRETENPHIRARTDKGLSPKMMFARAIVRPIKMLIFSPIVLALALFCAFVFGLIFLLYTTFPAVFELQYGFSPGVSGLSYLGIGIGMLVGLILFSILSDKILKKKTGSENAKPEYRLPLMIWFAPLTPVGFFWYGWSAQAQTHWIVPIIGTAFIGIGSLFVVVSQKVAHQLFILAQLTKNRFRRKCTWLMHSGRRALLLVLLLTQC